MHSQVGFWRRIGRALRLRCPRCGRGKLFVGWFRMPERCEECRLDFRREPGFYLGSIYVNYGLTALVVTVAYVWAMATGRLIYKTVQSLITHDDTIPSIDGNEECSWRRPATLAKHGADLNWDLGTIHVGRTYKGNHYKLISKLRQPMPRRAYELDHDVPKLVVERTNAP